VNPSPEIPPNHIPATCPACGAVVLIPLRKIPCLITCTNCDSELTINRSARIIDVTRLNGFAHDLNASP